MPRTLLLIMALAALAAPPARAASPLDTAALEAASRAGIMQFCQAQHAVSADTVKNARLILSRQTGHPSAAQLGEVEARGRAGILFSAGTSTPLAELGRQTGQTIPAMCSGMGMIVDMTAESLHAR